MMRNRPMSSIQKTYDECYLICSTAVFFESQNNESEALRSWKQALDQITFHNATKLPAAWYPRTEKEKTLWDALKQLEDQCNERVDLLRALKQSREEASQPETRSNNDSRLSLVEGNSQTWLGGDSVPPMQYSNLPSASKPPLPFRRASGGSVHTLQNDTSGTTSAQLGTPPSLPVPQNKTSRSPSPDQRKPMRTTLRPERKGVRYNKNMQQSKAPTTLKAAGLAWDTTQPRSKSAFKPEADPTIEARLSAQAARKSLDQPRGYPEDRNNSVYSMPDPSEYQARPAPAAQAGIASYDPRPTTDFAKPPVFPSSNDLATDATKPLPSPPSVTNKKPPPPPPPPHRIKPAELRYRKESYQSNSNVPASLATKIIDRAYAQPDPNLVPDPKPASLQRKPVTSSSVPQLRTKPPTPRLRKLSSDDVPQSSGSRQPRSRIERSQESGTITPPSSSDDDNDENTEDILEEIQKKSDFELRAEALMANLPRGCDPLAAKQIINEIVVKGDEVHWDDVAGLDLAKKALKEAVVYPFLRPDLFMGLREPARGMLLFGPPGTGKTMLARAVATESKSTFFAISASSLTSKWLGESEKLVRALFTIAKALAPSIIFVDEIDSLLNSRGGGTEHESSRRSKTEFLIQWSDLQRAAAGKDVSVGDASRVLVLAATNCPWDIDDAARRRFVRRQYIPLPERETRDVQIRTLLRSQNHSLSELDVVQLVEMTDGYSGSDITSLCKDAAMQPLRNLGEALLTTPIDQIQPISLHDFKASLESIRPSVSKKGLEQYENWAKEFGERGG